MGYLGSIVYSVVWIFIVISIIAASLKRASANKRINAIKNDSFAPNEKLYSNRVNTPPVPVRANPAAPRPSAVKPAAVKQNAGMILKDDIANDWLAGQLRDEARAMSMVSDMFQLKRDHMNSCDAEFIRRFHESNCDADGVDDGTRKSKKR